VIIDLGTRHALTVIAVEGFANVDSILAPEFHVHHVDMSDACSASPFCFCRPWLVYESKVNGSEIWAHHESVIEEG
jgi:hypothetical protein